MPSRRVSQSLRRYLGGLTSRTRRIRGLRAPADLPAPVPPSLRVPADGPLVTIVVAARNEGRFIETCIRSIAAQTWPAVECIAIDDASTDETLDRAAASAGNDPVFRFYANERPHGLATVRNQGLDLATGEYITFLDGDDALYPDAVTARMAVLGAEHSSAAPLGGVYCDWKAVPQDHVDMATAPPARDLGPVSWFDAITDAAFIASAPLLATSIARRVGGFDETMQTAEDAEFWNRVLRNGWVFEYAKYVGVAYRQKEQSMFRDTAIHHADVIAGIVHANFEPLPEHHVVPDAPAVFRRPAGEYLAELTHFRRLLIGLAISIHNDDEAATQHSLMALETAGSLHLSWVLDLDRLADEAAWRATIPLDEGREGRAALRTEVLAALSGVRPPQDRARADASNKTAGRPAREDAPSPIRAVESVPITAASASHELAGRLVLVPSAAYHVEELGRLAVVLAERNELPVFAVPTAYVPSVARHLGRYPFAVYELPEPGDWIGKLRALVILDDWGIHTKDVVVAAGAAGVATIAKVEGVQDFEDDDVPWKRDAYQTVARVLAQGQNDVDALPGKDTTIVGSTRLERIWLAPPRPYRQDLAVINLNFTYGVLEDSRDLWLSTAVEGCEHAGLPYVVSLHPAERDRYEGQVPIAEQPMRHLLTEASVLVSRFSTVPFEAMARGVPFVYHNPHGEQVPTFAEPDGAFETSDDAAPLAAAIKDSQPWVANYRERAANFFLRQVDVDPECPSEVRGAEAIVAILAEQG